MNSLYSLSEYEADPSFQSLSPEERDSFYQNYDAEKSASVQSEDDINDVLAERLTRKQSAFNLAYKAKNPEATKIDLENLDDDLKGMYEGINKDYNEQQHNLKTEPEAYKADDLETPTGALAYKPYKFNGQQGYSVSYPDGSYELIPNISDKVQLTDYLKKERAEKFTGKREGWLDKMIGDTEVESITNKMRGVESGLTGGFNELRKGWEGVKQGFATQGILEYGPEENAVNTRLQQEELDRVTNSIAYLEKRIPTLPDGPEKDQDEASLQKWREISKANEAMPKTKAERDQAMFNGESFEGGSKIPKYTHPQLKEKMLNLFDSMKTAQGIKGSLVMDDFNRYVQSLPEDQRGNNLKDFFYNNPSDIIPYVAAVAMSSAPDTAIGVGSAVVGSAIAGPVGGAALSGSYGAVREYSASLLSGLQNRANEEKVQLTPDLIESYTEDQAFMDSIKNRAATRAGVIGTADAVFGGAVGAITKGVKGAFKKTAFTTVADVATEMAGEGLAGAAVGEFSVDEMLQEGFGAMGTAVAMAPVSIYSENAQQKVAAQNDPTKAPTPEQKESKEEEFKARTEVTKDDLKERVKQASGGVIPKPSEQPTETFTDYPKQTKVSPIDPDLESINKSINESEKEREGFADKAKEEVDSQLTEAKSKKQANITTPDFVDKSNGRILYDRDSGPTVTVTPEKAAEMGEGTIIGRTDDNQVIVRTNNNPSVTSQLTDRPYQVSTPEDTLLKNSIVARFLDRKNKKDGTVPVNPDPKAEAKANAAATFENNPLAGPMMETLVGSYSRDEVSDILGNLRAVQLQDQAGTLMDSFGIQDTDASRRIIGNSLGNYWEATDAGSSDNNSYQKQAFNIARKLDNTYREVANVANMYEINSDNVEDISKNDIIFNIAPDGIVDYGSDTDTYTSQGLPYVDGAESIRRFETALKQGDVKRNRDMDHSLDDKFIEGSVMGRPNVLISRIADLGDTPQEVATMLRKLYPNGWVAKDAAGHAGGSATKAATGDPFPGQYFSTDSFLSKDEQVAGMVAFMQRYPADYQNWYVESLAQLPTDSQFPRSPDNMEHRVHLYVDKSGQAHVFRNLTFDKSTPTNAAWYRMGVTSEPANPNSPLVKALQEYAQKLFTGKPHFNDMIMGVDIAMVKRGGKDTPFVFEANALTYGMSGWLGNPFATSEIMSVMTGRPSYVTGLYELAKSQLTEKELLEVKNLVNEGMPSAYFANPEYYRALEKGVALWNRYIPIDSWYNAMEKMFHELPSLQDFLKNLWHQIGSAFFKVVDPIFSKISGSKRYFPAYHGTGKTGVSQFDYKFLGTGTGNQVQGYGFYVTEGPRVALSYKNALAQRLYDGQSLNENDPRHIAALMMDTAQGNKDKAIIQAERYRDSALNPINPESIKRKADLYNKVLTSLHFDDYASIETGGAVYALNIKPEKNKFLDFDLHVTEQPAAIQEVLKKLMPSEFTRPHPSFDGKAAYHALSSSLGGDQEASEALLSYGIKGNRYSETRGADGYTHNYVVFDPADIEVIAENGRLVKGAEKESQLTERTLPAKKNPKRIGPAFPDMVPTKESKTLDKYLDQVLASTDLSAPQRTVLQYIKNKFPTEELSAISVQAIKGSNFYSVRNDKLVIDRANPLPMTVVHEIIHAVTSNYIESSIFNLKQKIKFNEYDNNETLQAYLKVIDKGERKSLIAAGVPAEFIDLVTSYMSFLDSIGITAESIANGEDRVGSLNARNYTRKTDLPYGALNIDEFVAEALSRGEFQEQLSTLPSVVNRVKSMLQDVFVSIMKTLGIPFNKGSLLGDVVYNFQSIVESFDNQISSRPEQSLYQNVEGNWIYETNTAEYRTLYSDNNEMDVYSTDGINYKSGEVADPEGLTRQMTEVERDLVEQETKKEIQSNRFKAMQLENPELATLEDTDENFTKAREVVTDKLAAAVEIEDSKPQLTEPEEISPEKQEQIDKLTKNKYLAARSLIGIIDKDGVTYSIAEALTESFEFIMTDSADPTLLTLRKLKYYNNALESLSDENGIPVGMKYLIGHSFHVRQYSTLVHLQNMSGLKFNKPIGDWRRKPLFNIGVAGGSSSVMHSTEIAHVGRTQDGITYLQELMGEYKANIDQKELEQEALDAEFFEYINNTFPGKSFRPLNSYRVGIVARLTQYERGVSQIPLDQIKSRYSQLTESLKQAPIKSNPVKDAISNEAYNTLGNDIDPANFPDHDAYIKHLEGKLTPAEMSVLTKARDMGARYQPTMKLVKALTKNAQLDDWANYIHDSSITPKAPTEAVDYNNLDSLSTVLVDRRGMNPFTTYPELDIGALVKLQNKAVAYEKHTGVERSRLAAALKQNSQLSRAIDKGQNGVRPVSDRLRELLITYHNSMTSPQAQANPMWSLLESAIGVAATSLIIGMNAITKNFFSSFTARAALASIGAQDKMFVYDTNKTKLDKWIKDNFPTQSRRTSHYDNIPGRDDSWSLWGQTKALKDAKAGIKEMLIRIGPQIPEAMLRTFQTNILSTLTDISNAKPEKYNALATWVAAYIQNMIDEGLVVDTNDFLNRLPVNPMSAYKANEFVSRTTGYAPDKASKGSFWNGSSRDKQIISRLFFLFSQQKVGLAVEFQSNMINMAANLSTGQLTEATKFMNMASVNLANGLMFRWIAIGLSSGILWTGLEKYLSSGDDEEKRKAIAKANKDYTQSAGMSQLRDGLTETAEMFLPVANAAIIFENVVKVALDANEVVLSPGEDNFLKIQNEQKKDLREEVDAIGIEIKELEDSLKLAIKYDNPTNDIEEAIDKLKTQKDRLTIKSKFKYFPSRGPDAAFSILGAYGIGLEDSYNMMQSFIGEDLSDEDKQQLEEIIKNDFAYQDNLAGTFYGSDMLRSISDTARMLFPSEWMKEDYEKVPTDLFWKSYLKATQNPSVMVERARKAMAKELLDQRKEAQQAAEEIHKKYTGEE